ncbi:transmembrane protein, putative (macronuclear) [Tetrahymena thermophila SB210]|uniref:Transmembrane protein, putative n=1 Tax=Tetrahymena thermophila (strain SB210) TaxID=312017 RepID=I7LUV8_TETTS|nr:transmembrane protein, putative [Tetrahymena thermophila SB210]EAR96139.2 transmembrane protein, putative [Tetrahymena thermophila SB210]|eukprot:XP_001016384.2 transmembrane protein, putative [Tetrahymena thermophila SB210]
MQVSKIGVISASLALVSGIIITFSLQALPLMSDLWSYFYIFVILLIINGIVFAYLLDTDNNVFALIAKSTAHGLFFIGGIVIFLCMYFVIFYPLQSMTFESFNDCSISGKLTKNLQGSEAYSILYVNFKYKDQNMLGYACQSNQNTNQLGDEPYPYKFITNGTYYNCEKPVRDQSSYDVAPRAIAFNKRQRVITNTQVNYYRSRSSVNSGKLKGCQPYNFSQVKIPSWACLDFNLSYEKLTQSQKCYVNFYENEDKAKENSQARMDLRGVNNFAFVSFSYPLNYDKDGFSYIIIFAYYPLLISFDFIFYLILLAFKQ